MKGSAQGRGGNFRSSFDEERESVLVGTELAVGNHVQEDQDASGRIRSRGVSADECVPGEGVWLGNLIEHLAGVIETREGGEGGDGE